MRLSSTPRQRLRVQRLDGVGAWIGGEYAANGRAGPAVRRTRTTPDARKLRFGRLRALMLRAKVASTGAGQTRTAHRDDALCTRRVVSDIRACYSREWIEVALCESLAVHTLAAGVCTSLRKTKRWSAATQSSAAAAAMTPSVQGPTLGGAAHGRLPLALNTSIDDNSFAPSSRRLQTAASTAVDSRHRSVTHTAPSCPVSCCQPSNRPACQRLAPACRIGTPRDAQPLSVYTGGRPCCFGRMWARK
jgi:hypothetical protein